MTTHPGFKLHLEGSPELQSLVLHNVTPTGKLFGSGSYIYGNVIEVAIPGALCAAKKIHDFLSRVDPKWLAKETAEENIRKFVEECKLMNRLRHPNIVQFIGIWVAESSLPALVMEKMLMSLHDLLEPDEAMPKTPTPQIPLGLKYTILQDIAQGIAFLHNQSPPVVHRDLSARNVLLNSAMVAKIADMGMARILPDKPNVTMTKAPGAHVYMPPEALENKSHYDTSIDLFSLGVIAIFVLIQEFPHNLKPPTYTDKKGKFCGRTELERREVYMEKIYSMFSMTNASVHLIIKCLQNDPKHRPSVDNALKTIGQAVKQVKDYDILHSSKLELLQVVEKKAELLHQQEKKLEFMQEKCSWLKEEVKILRDEMAQLNQENARLQQELAQATEKKKKKKYKNYEDQENLPMTPPVLPIRQSSSESKPHERIENWYKEVDRDYATKLLNDCVDGTFLCRPASKETKVPSGGFHTYTIDCVHDGIIKSYQVIKHNDKYGRVAPCIFESLMELVLYFSGHSVCRSEKNVILKFPVFCNDKKAIDDRQ